MVKLLDTANVDYYPSARPCPTCGNELDARQDFDISEQKSDYYYELGIDFAKTLYKLIPWGFYNGIYDELKRSEKTGE